MTGVASQVLVMGLRVKGAQARVRMSRLNSLFRVGMWQASQETLVLCLFSSDALAALWGRAVWQAPVQVTGVLGISLAMPSVTKLPRAILCSLVVWQSVQSICRSAWISFSAV